MTYSSIRAIALLCLAGVLLPAVEIGQTDKNNRTNERRGTVTNRSADD